ncbi:MAG: NAD(P)-dependent oxidoreductase [Desulfamplus sp.]|nr:NAD(P)-dependent oxidoreductase [Desulfamplus sp.]
MIISPNNTTVGFIGTGVMGSSMAGHILKAGYKLHVYSRTKSKADELCKNGAVWEDRVQELAKKCNVIITIVGFPSDVEEIYLKPDGIIPNAKPETIVIDMTTSSPLLASKIYGAAKERAIHALDAPVSGGDIGARGANLSIMVGGDKDSFEAAMPIFSLMGKNIQLQGKAGSGQHTKMVNQISIAAGMVGLCESFAYAKKSGLDLTMVLKSIETGAAASWTLSNLGPRIIKGDFAPGFYVKHIIKDMGIAIDSAEEMGLDLPGLKLAKSLYDKLAQNGYEYHGTQSLYSLFI